MNRYLSSAALFIVMLLAQVLIFNHICLFGYAVPLVFIYFIMHVPMDFGPNRLLTCSFLLGFLVDIWSDTPGMNSLACTILAALRNRVFYAYESHDDKAETLIPSIRTLGWSTFSKYAVTLTAIYAFLIFSIEYFSVANVKDIVFMAVASTAFTFPLILAIDCLMVSQREKRL